MKVVSIAVLALLALAVDAQNFIKLDPAEVKAFLENKQNHVPLDAASRVALIAFHEQSGQTLSKEEEESLPRHQSHRKKENDSQVG